MQETKYITVIAGRRKTVINADTILYVIMRGKIAEIHISGGKNYETRMSLGEIEKQLGDRFLKVHRGCLVSAMAIHDISDKINLNNGESIEYPIRKKKHINNIF